MKTRFVRLIGFLIVSAWLLLNPGQPTTAQAGPERGRSQTVTVAFGGLLGFAYSPKAVFILPGDSVHWQGDFAAHPLVSDGGLWQRVESGTEFTYTFDQPGVYPYHCFFHGAMGMTGTVTVGYRVLLPLIDR